MKNVLKIALASAAVFGASTPAAAAVLLTTVNGPNLPVAIKASTTNTQNDNAVVFGCTQNNGQCDNVRFTANTLVHITDGAGYAAISDFDGAGGSGVFTALISDPQPDFNAYQFSIQLAADGFFLVQYSTDPAGALFTALTGPLANPISQNKSTNKDYQITATAGEQLTAIRISTCATALLSSCNLLANQAGTGVGIELFKQNSINLATVPPPIPEPATWGMMLLGFGGIGMAMRRSRRRNGALMQIA